MSASRTLLASKKRNEVSEEEYDSEEERYFRNQERLLKKVEESAKAIRTLTEITRPFVTGTWRLEREELRNNGLPVTVSSGLPCKENNPGASDGSDDEFSTSSFRQIVWSPVKHAKTTDVNAVLEMEKIPQWKFLRKSKVRLSSVQNGGNDTKSPAVGVDKPLTSQSSHSECTTSTKPVSKLSERPLDRPNYVGNASRSQVRRRKLDSDHEIATPKPSCIDEGHRPSELGSESLDNCVADAATESNVVPKEPNLPAPTTPSHCKDDMSTPLKDDMSTPLRKSPRFQKTFKSPVRCSPILLQAYGKEFAQVRGSIGSPDKVVNLEECTSPKDPSKVLKGIVAYVEVRRGEDDRTGGFRWKLKQLGATVSDTLNKKVTHVVFQEGLLSTFRKAKVIGAHIVSAHWVMACDESFTRVSESRYPIENLSQYEDADADPLQKCIKRPKIMSPDLGTGRDDKKLSKRFKTIARKSMLRVESPLAKSAIITTPLPESPKVDLKPKSPSPKKRQSTEPDSDDDWDGFLAMIEAEVREKAKSKIKSGEISETVKDFEIRLQQLLGGQSNAQVQEEKHKTSEHLAPLFEKKKVSNPVPTKVSPKKAKRVKPKVGSAASSIAMMKWLQMQPPGTSKGGSSQFASTAAAASNAADEILKSIFQSVEVEDSVKFEKATISKDPQELVNLKSINASKKDLTSSVRKRTSAKLSQQDSSPFLFATKSNNTKVDKTVKRPVKKAKMEFKGSQGCSDMMRSWLSVSKSPTQSHHSPVKVIKDETKNAPLTPRRRSLRLTPVKKSLMGSITYLDPLEEEKVSNSNVMKP